MPRVVEGSQPTSDHAVLAVLPSMSVEGPGGGRAAAAGELEGPAGGRVAAAGDELAMALAWRTEGVLELHAASVPHTDL